MYPPLSPNQASVSCAVYAGRSQFLWPDPGLPRIPMDEALFLQPAAEAAGPAVDNFCLGVIQVLEVRQLRLALAVF